MEEYGKGTVWDHALQGYIAGCLDDEGGDPKAAARKSGGSIAYNAHTT